MGQAAIAAQQQGNVLYDRWKENYRQDLITEALKALSRVYEGGTYGTGYVNPADIRPGQVYYTATGEAYTVPRVIDGTVLSTPRTGLPALPGTPEYAPPTGPLLPGQGGGTAPASGAKPIGEVLNPNGWEFWKAATNLPVLYSDKATTEGFGDAFYNKRRDAYLDYAMPQVQQQYGNAQKDIAYALSRAGTTDSTMAGSRYTDLGSDFSLKQREIADTAQNLANTARADVATSRANAENTLYSTANPEVALQQALTSARNLQTSSPTFSPLGALFTNASAGLAGYMEGSRYDALKKSLASEYGALPSIDSSSSGRNVKS